MRFTAVCNDFPTNNKQQFTTLNELRTYILATVRVVSTFSNKLTYFVLFTIGIVACRKQISNGYYSETLGTYLPSDKGSTNIEQNVWPYIKIFESVVPTFSFEAVEFDLRGTNNTPHSMINSANGTTYPIHILLTGFHKTEYDDTHYTFIFICARNNSSNQTTIEKKVHSWNSENRPPVGGLTPLKSRVAQLSKI